MTKQKFANYTYKVTDKSQDVEFHVIATDTREAINVAAKRYNLDPSNLGEVELTGRPNNEYHFIHPDTEEIRRIFAQSKPHAALLLKEAVSSEEFLEYMKNPAERVGPDNRNPLSVKAYQLMERSMLSASEVDAAIRLVADLLFEQADYTKQTEPYATRSIKETLDAVRLVEDLEDIFEMEEGEE